MAIISDDLVYRLSGGATNTIANDSLGGDMSTVGGGIIPDATGENLFDNVTGGEASSGDVEYRGFYVENAHGSLTLQNAVIWIDQDTTSTNDEIDIALALEAIDVSMATIADESTAPASVTFSHPNTKATGLSIGSLPAGSFKGVWIRRTVDAGAGAASGNQGGVRLEGDTEA
jgi:hypothetical protein